MILREAFDYEFSRLDPTGPHIDPCHLAVYELLMVKGPDWAPHPRLAESWEFSEDGLQLADPAAARRALPLRGPLRRAGRARARSSIFATSSRRASSGTGIPVDTVEAEDERTLVFRLRYPYSRLPSLLWGTHTTIYNEALREAEPDRFGFERRRRHGAVPARVVGA